MIFYCDIKKLNLDLVWVYLGTLMMSSGNKNMEDSLTLTEVLVLIELMNSRSALES